MPNPQVKIYSLPTCAFCNLAKEYFKAKGIEYEDVDILENQSAGEEMVRKTGQTSVPVIEYKDKIIIGYQKATLDALFG